MNGCTWAGYKDYWIWFEIIWIIAPELDIKQTNKKKPFFSTRDIDNEKFGNTYKQDIGQSLLRLLGRYRCPTLQKGLRTAGSQKPVLRFVYKKIAKGTTDRRIECSWQSNYPNNLQQANPKSWQTILETVGKRCCQAFSEHGLLLSSCRCQQSPTISSMSASEKATKSTSFQLASSTARVT